MIQDSEGQPSTTEHNVLETHRGLEFMTAASGGLSVGAGAHYATTDTKSTNEASFAFRENELLESITRLEGRGKASLELTKDLRLGAIVRYRHLESDVLGSFFLPNDERTKYSGGLIGAGAGAQFNASSARLAVQYLSPLQGKVGIHGENKVTSDPGRLSACGHFDIGEGAAGGCYFIEQYAKDELREPSTGPNPANQTPMSPLGVRVDQRLYLRSTAAVGLSFGARTQFKATGFLENYEATNDPSDSTLGDAAPENIVTGYRARLSFGFSSDKVFAELGGDGAWRSHKREQQNNGQIDEADLTEYNIYGTIGIGF